MSKQIFFSIADLEKPCTFAQGYSKFSSDILPTNNSSWVSREDENVVRGKGWYGAEGYERELLECLICLWGEWVLVKVIKN